VQDDAPDRAGRHPGPLVSVADPEDLRLADYRHLNDPAARRRIDAERSIIVVEGRLAVARLLESDLVVRSLLVDDRQATSSSGLVEATRARGATVFVGSPDVVAGTVGFALHRGVVAVASRPEAVDARSVVVGARRAGGIDGGPPVVAVLEGLNDHENIGALFRNAAAFGVGAVLLDPTCADPLYRRSIRVSVGHVLHLPFARVAPWPDTLQLLRAEGFVVAAMAPGGADLDASGSSGPLDAHVGLADLRDRSTADGFGGVALLLGAEGPGLSPEALELSDLTVSIPMAPGVDSLNVATAAAIAFHALRRG